MSAAPSRADGGMLFSDESFQPSRMFDAKGEFQFFVPGVEVGPRQPNSAIAIGFIDSGTTSRHPQLSGLVLEEKSFVDGPPYDELGHGTWAMLVSLVPDPNAQFAFYSAKVTRDGSDLQASNVIAAFRWLVAKKVNVINMSLGFSQMTADVKRLCDSIAAEPSVMVVAAAGNFGADVKVYPAHCGAPNVMAVGESKNGQAVDTSGRGQVYAEPPRFLSRWAFLNERARLETRAGLFESAEALYRESLSVQDNPEALHELALLAARKNDWPSAKTFAARAVALAPKESELHQTFGAVLLSLKDFDQAVTEFQAALQLDPRNQKALLNLARTQIAQGNHVEASGTLDRAFANEPSDQRIADIRRRLAAPPQPKP